MAFIDDKINKYADNILTRGDINDTSSLGELKFYISIRNVVKTVTQTINDYEKSSREDEGLFDALADTLMELDLITDKKELCDKLKDKIEAS